MSQLPCTCGISDPKTFGHRHDCAAVDEKKQLRARAERAEAELARQTTTELPGMTEPSGTIGDLIDRVVDAGGSAVVNVDGTCYRVTVYSVIEVDDE